MAEEAEKDFAGRQLNGARSVIDRQTDIWRRKLRRILQADRILEADDHEDTRCRRSERYEPADQCTA